MHRCPQISYELADESFNLSMSNAGACVVLILLSPVVFVDEPSDSRQWQAVLGTAELRLLLNQRFILCPDTRSRFYARRDGIPSTGSWAPAFKA